MILSVLLLNKTTLKNGVTGPILNAFKATPDELIYELENTSPTPRFRSGNKELTVEFLNELINYHSEAQAKVNVESPKTNENVATNNTANNSNSFKNKNNNKNNYKNNNQNTADKAADKAAEVNTESDTTATQETEETSTAN